MMPMDKGIRNDSSCTWLKWWMKLCCVTMCVTSLAACSDMGAGSAGQKETKQSTAQEGSARDRQADRALAALIERNPHYDRTMSVERGQLLLPAPTVTGSDSPSVAALASWDLQKLSTAIRDTRKTVKLERTGGDQYLVIQLNADDWTIRVENNWRSMLQSLESRDKAIREEAKTLSPVKQEALIRELDNGPSRKRKDLEAAIQTLRAEGSTCRLKLRTDSELPGECMLQNVLSYGSGNTLQKEVQSITYTIY